MALGARLHGSRVAQKCSALARLTPVPNPRHRCSVRAPQAVHIDKLDVRACYECPVYATPTRFRQELFSIYLPTRHPWTKWTTAGVCLLMEEP